MTSESGVLSFLSCWLGPPGVSKAASASYIERGRRRVGSSKQEIKEIEGKRGEKGRER